MKEVQPKYFLLENVIMKQEAKDEISSLVGVEPIRINSKVIVPQLRDRLYWTNVPYEQLIKHYDHKLQDTLTDGYTDRDKARCLLESDSRPLTTPVKMFHRYHSSGFTTLIFKDKPHYESCKAHYNENFKGKKASDIHYEGDVYDGVRYLDKRELQLLQGIPPMYLDKLPRNKVAGLVGDGWSLPVIINFINQMLINDEKDN